jgi:hypothetical protein
VDISETLMLRLPLGEGRATFERPAESESLPRVDRLLSKHPSLRELRAALAELTSVQTLDHADQPVDDCIFRATAGSRTAVDFEDRLVIRRVIDQVPDAIIDDSGQDGIRERRVSLKSIRTKRKGSLMA